MISTKDITLAFGQRVLFKDVTVKFLPGNCYGLIGANGAGKSTFLKILSGELEQDSGDVTIPPGQRLAVLKQNQFEFDDFEVLKTVLMGNKKLYDIMTEKDALYAKEDFSDDDGVRASELEVEFADLNGWDAESQAAEMLAELGVSTDLHTVLMKDLEAGQKFKVLLSQALFGDPDILLLDEPTNNLDMKSIMWLEEFLCEFKNTVVVVSHDRRFLDQVSTHIADIDFNQMTLYSGNYSFWYQSSQLVLQQRQDRNKKTSDKVKELKAFIERFSANASKSKQATSRKKSLDRLQVEEIKPSTRKYPHIVFNAAREAGKDLLITDNLSSEKDGEKIFTDLNMTVMKGEKIAFVGKDLTTASHLLEILAEEIKPTSGELRWGITTTRAYFPKEHDEFFHSAMSLIDWLRQYAETKEERDEEYVRGFLGKMLFSGQEATKMTNVLSGGEKVRCMLSKMMLLRGNVLILNEPTAHLDLESITALNNSLIEFPGTVLFISQDREFIDTIATRIVEITPKGFVDKEMRYSEYLRNPEVTVARESLY
jgi:ATPase subunit of ABC transporter with duplicated ATPase domains